MQAGDANLEIVVHDTVEALKRIRPAWDRLLAAAERHSMTSAYPYVRCAWEVVSRDRRVKLAVIGAWRGEELVGIWPLCVHPRFVGRVTDHLGDGSTHQYGGPVLRDDTRSEDVAQAMFAAAFGLADSLHAQNLRVGTGGHARVASQSGFRRFRGVDAPVVRLSGFSGWDEWVATKSQSFRYSLRVDRKKLAAQGDLVFAQKMGEEARRCAEWMIDTKQAQLKQQGLMGSYLWRPQIREVLLALADAGPESGVMFHALTLDGDMVAASMCVLGSDILEYHYFATNPAYAAYSPGGLITQECLTLAIQLGRDLDFRLSREAYKLRWADASNRYESFFMARTPVGRMQLAYDALMARIEHWRETRKPVKAPDLSWLGTLIKRQMVGLVLYAPDLVVALETL
jgi:CelD/BcsL family acetyltransferase involved in cellulose biosynthesis